MRKTISAVVVALLISVSLQADQPVLEFKNWLRREDGQKIQLTLSTEAVTIRHKKTATTIPFATINRIVYDRRRSGTAFTILPGISSSKVDHWLTITHSDLSTGGYYTFRIRDEGALNRLLGNLEARSGIRIERTGS